MSANVANLKNVSEFTPENVDQECPKGLECLGLPSIYLQVGVYVYMFGFTGGTKPYYLVLA